MTTKEKITEAALALFAEKGYKGTSVKNIADAVGIKDASLYNHFKSKQEIFDSIVVLIMTHISDLSQTLRMPQYDTQSASVSEFYEKLDLKALKDLSREAFVFYLTDPYISKFWRIAHMEQYANPQIYTMFRKIFKTDASRGEGIYGKVLSVMDKMQKEKLLFGSSVTVTKENLKEVTSDDFLNTLEDRGCKAVFYVEFVPMSSEMKELAPGDEEREYMENRLAEIRAKHRNMIFLSFPGDEKSLGGCIAAGRGFFHINSHGGAEPCPFSPYSDVNVRDTSLREALHSELFMKLQSSGTLTQEHIGGCVLYENRDKVDNCLMQNKKSELTVV